MCRATRMWAVERHVTAPAIVALGRAPIRPSARSGAGRPGLENDGVRSTTPLLRIALAAGAGVPSLGSSFFSRRLEIGGADETRRRGIFYLGRPTDLAWLAAGENGCCRAAVVRACLRRTCALGVLCLLSRSSCAVPSLGTIGTRYPSLMGARSALCCIHRRHEHTHVRNRSRGGCTLRVGAAGFPLPRAFRLVVVVLFRSLKHLDVALSRTHVLPAEIGAPSASL